MAISADNTPVVHHDQHVDGNYHHVTLVTDEFIATFHRNRDEVATLLPGNVTVKTNDSIEEIINTVLETAQDHVAPVIKYDEPIETAVRWGCDSCGHVTDTRGETPETCPDCDVLLVREGSPIWLASTHLPDKRLFP